MTITLLETDSLSNQNISSALAVGSYTATGAALIYARLYAQGLTGGGDYVFYLTVTPSGLSESVAGPKTTYTASAGETTLFGATIGVPVSAGDVLKVYIDGLSTDTTTPDTVVDWYYDNSVVTVGQTAAAVTAAVSGSTLTIHRGDTWSATLTGLSANTGYVTIDLTVKRDKDDADTAAIIKIRKNASGVGDGLLYLNGAAGTAAQGSITVVSATSLTFTLSALSSDDLVSEDGLYYDIQYIFASSVTTATYGQCNITADVTRAVV